MMEIRPYWLLSNLPLAGDRNDLRRHEKVTLFREEVVQGWNYPCSLDAGCQWKVGVSQILIRNTCWAGCNGTRFLKVMIQLLVIFGSFCSKWYDNTFQNQSMNQFKDTRISFCRFSTICFS